MENTIAIVDINHFFNSGGGKRLDNLHGFMVILLGGLSKMRGNIYMFSAITLNLCCLSMKYLFTPFL